MPTYTLLLFDDAGREVGELECPAPNPWMALEKSKKAIGRTTVELREGEHSYGRFRSAFPLKQVWELSPTLRRPTKT